MTIVYGWLPSATASSTPVTVTVWALFQFAVVKVRLAGLTVPSVVSLLESPIVTLAVGWVLQHHREAGRAPASVVTRPLTGFTVIPGEGSLSVFVTATSAGFSPL